MDVYEFEDIRASIRPRLIKRDSCQVQIKKVPYIGTVSEKLLVVFYVELGRVNNMDIGFYISNKHLKMWNISMQELLDSVVIH